MYPCKKNILLPLILLCFLISACSSNMSTPSTIPPTESLPAETVSESLPFEFLLPPEYQITDTQRISQNSIQQHLTISATKETEPGFYIHIPSEELGGNYSEDLVYFGFSNVQIDLNGTLHPLETAIRDGLISMEEIFAHARIDARNGFCQETSETNHGLTHFTYQYPDTEFKLRLTYDIYETPDGQSHLINEFLLLDTNASSTDNYHNEETGMLLDFENWGLDFEIISTSPNGITLRCTQSGGQQFGMLYPESYTLSRVIQQNEQDTLSYLTRVRLESTAPISSNDSSQITIDWPEEISELAPGRYSMCLYIKDVYDISAVHPLMENFHDIQGYWIAFDIP